MTRSRDSLDPALVLSLAQVREVYREMETRRVERDCVLRTDCCRFRLTGLTPYLTRGEALVAALALRAVGSTSVAVRSDGACPLLNDDGKCRIYDGRPLGCRTHFCDEAGGPYPRRDVLDLIRRLEAVDHELGGDGARTLPAALQQAIADLGRREDGPRSSRRRDRSRRD